MSGTSAVFTIPAGHAFVDALAAGLLRHHGGEPLALARLTLLLPTRRAARAMREAFLRASGGRALLLPRFGAVGDVDDEEAALLEPAAAVEALPPAIPALRRRLLLAQLVEKETGAGPAAAAQLADELARLLDQLHTEDVPLTALADLVPADLAAHWQAILGFLRLLAAPWQAILAAEGALDPADRRRRALADLAGRWRERPPPGPVVAAGSTGSQPATAALMAVIARLPQGAVVLPGLDEEMDEASWAQLGPGHPQFGLKQLLARLAVAREDVRPWPALAALDEARTARRRLLGEALRPAATTDRWIAMPPVPATALAGLSRIDCPDPQTEAGVIALLMRESLERPVGRCALVTPDRGLARRVAAALARWNLAVDDSAGRPLRQTPPGALLCLVAEAVGAGFAPVPLLAVLNHALVAAGRPPGRFGRLVRRLEIELWRGPRPAPGLTALRDAAAACADLDEAALALVDELCDAAAPLAALIDGRADLPALVEAHVALAEWLARDEAGRIRLWDGEAGEAAADFVAGLRQAAVALPPQPGAAYPALFGQLMDETAVRPRAAAGARLAIWGPLEARLQHADLLILGGLNEETWPAGARGDPWLSRPMRAQLGLPPPERRLGQAAHDFVQLAAAPQVVLTRAEKVEGTPTVASRWLLRLDQVLARAGLAWDARRKTDLIAWHRALFQPPASAGAGSAVRPVPAPRPTPPLAARPRRLSVTHVETWMRDPYGVYARHVLRLKALDPLEQDPGAAERGTAVHQALHRFVREFPEALPAGALDRLLAIGREELGALLDRPGFRAFWWPWFERAARQFIAVERRRRAAWTPLRTEVDGRLELATAAGAFVLTAKADRIDRGRDGSLDVIDYKTGVVPTGREVALGLAPQLPLEAAMARAGGFADVPACAAVQTSYWSLRRDAAGPKPLNDPARLADEALAGLQALVAAFDDPATPYLCCPRPSQAPRFNDYELLARRPEWAAVGMDLI